MIIESGKAISARRKAYDYTQEKLAEILDVDVTTIQNWETGKRVGRKNMRPLYRFLGFDNLLQYNSFKLLVTYGFLDDEIITYDKLSANPDETDRNLIELEYQLNETKKTLEELDSEKKESEELYESVLDSEKRIIISQKIKIDMLEYRNKFWKEKYFKACNEIEALKGLVEQ